MKCLTQQVSNSCVVRHLGLTRYFISTIHGRPQRLAMVFSEMLGQSRVERCRLHCYNVRASWLYSAPLNFQKIFTRWYLVVIRVSFAMREFKSLNLRSNIFTKSRNVRSYCSIATSVIVVFVAETDCFTFHNLLLENHLGGTLLSMTSNVPQLV